jgi:type II secretion system protein G
MIKNGSRGFTLVELIIVIIIIGILAAVAIPKYMNAVERAKIGKAKTGLGMITKAEKMYVAENSSFSTDTANGGALDKYVEMTDMNADADWGYVIAGTTAAFTATATKKAGMPHAGETVTLTNLGAWSGTHTLL